MKRRIGVLAALALALPVASASAADGVKRVESSTSGQTVSDGVRYVSWTVGTDVRVLDDQSGAVASYRCRRAVERRARSAAALRRRSAARGSSC